MTAAVWNGQDTKDLVCQARSNPTRMLWRLATMPKDSLPTVGMTLRAYIDQQGMTASRLICLTGLSKQYIYQILNNQRAPGRNALITIAVFLRLGYEETQHLLRIAQKPPLYAKITRDAAIICCIESRFDFNRINDTLIRLGESPLLVSQR